jgi:Na+/proline symporter
MRNILRVATKVAEERQALMYARLGSLILLLAAGVIALNFEDVPQAMRFVWKVLPLTGIAFFMGILWRRANRYGAWASFIGATGALLLGQLGFGWNGDARLPRLILFYLGCGLLSGIVVTYLTPREDPKLLHDFYMRLGTPVGKERDLEEAGVKVTLR